MNQSRPETTVVVLRTSDLTQLAVVRSLLEAHGIPCSASGEQTVGLSAGSGFPGLLSKRPLGAELRVPGHHASTALELIEELPSPSEEAT